MCRCRTSSGPGHRVLGVGPYRGIVFTKTRCMTQQLFKGSIRGDAVDGHVRRPRKRLKRIGDVLKGEPLWKVSCTVGSHNLMPTTALAV
eukprot:2243397-Pyramimonas_sp.AAC.1